MIPDTIHDMLCPTCKQKLIFEVTEEILVPPKFEIPLRLCDGHEISLNTTHYAESTQGVSLLMLVIVTYCPGELGEDQPDPWRRLCQFWKTTLSKTHEEITE